MSDNSKSRIRRKGRRPVGQPSAPQVWWLFLPDSFVIPQFPTELIPFMLCPEQKPAFQNSMLSRIYKGFIN